MHRAVNGVSQSIRIDKENFTARLEKYTKCNNENCENYRGCVTVMNVALTTFCQLRKRHYMVRNSR